MLAAEGALFLWISDRLAARCRRARRVSLPDWSPRMSGAALARDANLNLETYLREQYKDVVQTFFVVLRDGRIASNHDDVPAEIVGAAFVPKNTALLAGRGGRRTWPRAGRAARRIRWWVPAATRWRVPAAALQIWRRGGPSW
jgi:hypothetical protein